MNAPDTLTAMRPGSSAANGPELVAWEMIRTLVAFDTTSRESNLALIDWVRGYLESYGAQCTMTFDDDRRKANLFATLPRPLQIQDVGYYRAAGSIKSSACLNRCVPYIRDDEAWRLSGFSRARRNCYRDRRH